jgi:hypothetical protein
VNSDVPLVPPNGQDLLGHYGIAQNSILTQIMANNVLWTLLELTGQKNGGGSAPTILLHLIDL